MAFTTFKTDRNGRAVVESTVAAAETGRVTGSTGALSAINFAGVDVDLSLFGFNIGDLLNASTRGVAETIIPRVARQVDSQALQGAGSAAPTETFRGQLPEGNAGRRAYFRIYFKRPDGSSAFYKFALLPAVENFLPMAAQGAKVPEVKTGICLYTKVRHRSIVVPGSTPVQQTIGVESKILMLVGVFLGEETVEGGAPANPGTQGTGFNSNTVGVGVTLRNRENGYRLAQDFDKQVVMGGDVVKVDIWSPAYNELGDANYSGVSVEDLNSNTVVNAMRIEAEGLITGFRNCTSRMNRSYYAIDITLTKYEARLRNAPQETSTSAAPAASPAPTAGAPVAPVAPVATNPTPAEVSPTARLLDNRVLLNIA